MHCFAHGVVSPKRERNIAQTTTRLCPWERLLDLTHRLDKINRVVIMLLDPGCHGKDVRVEDNVFGIKADLVNEEPVCAGADTDFFSFCRGLTLLVEGHHNDCSPVASGKPCPLQESLLAVL